MNRVVRNWIFAALVIGVLAVVSGIMAPFVPAILWATALSILTQPVYKKMRDRLAPGRFGKQAETLAGLGACAITIITFLLPFVIVGFGFVAQAQNIPQVSTGEQADVLTTLRNLDVQLASFKQTLGVGNFSIEEFWTKNRQEILTSLRTPAASLAKNIGFTLFTLGIAILAQFFFLA
jgi:predicted PurR-regulated permease PerM